MLDKLTRKIVRSLERKQQYSFERCEDATGRPFRVSRADVRVGDKVYACDTAIDIDPGQPRGSERAGFTTFIHEGISGRNAEAFNRVVDVLNYEYPGKFVRDYTDGTQDVLYTTRERVTNLTSKVVAENLDHHARVKAAVTPALERLKTQLDSEPKRSATEAESFALDWAKTFKRTRELTQGGEITYLPQRIGDL